MKTLNKVVSLVVLSTALNSQLNAQVVVGGTQIGGQPNDEFVADKFAVADVDYWRGQYSFMGVNDSGTNQINASFTLQIVTGQWAITKLSSGTNNVPIDPDRPLWQLPAYDGAVLNFNLNAWGYKSDSQITRNGYFSSQELKPGAEIKIAVSLNYVSVSIPYTFSGDHNASNTSIRSQDGRYSGGYNSQTGSFIIGYDPLSPPDTLVLVDNRDSHIFYSVGFNQITSNEPVVDSNHGIDFQIQGGTLEAYTKPEGNTSFNNLTLDQNVVRSGTNYNAKIAIMHVASTDYVQVYAYGLSQGSWVEAYGYNADGTATFLGYTQVQNDGYSTIISNLTGYSTYKIVEIGLALDPISGTSIGLYRTSYKWTWATTGGGGKG